MAVIAERLWRGRFGGDLSAIGAAATIDGQAFTIVGIAPATFDFPAQTKPVDVWLPITATRSMVVSQALGLGAAGLGVGLAAALALTRVLASLLFGVSASDPLTFSAVCALLMTVVGAAAYLPARRATHVDPVVALRAD